MQTGVDTKYSKSPRTLAHQESVAFDLPAPSPLTLGGARAWEDLHHPEEFETGGDLVEETDWDETLRRGLNVVVAAVGLVLALPLMAVIALLIKATSPGPVLYVQTRVGVDRRRRDPDAFVRCRRAGDNGGRPFKIYKFRTMTVEPPDATEKWACEETSRITPVGRFLRQYRLDEVPQLWNVIKGDMNIVGPRPEQPTIFVTLREKVDEYPRRQKVLPGITGWAQINQGYDHSIDDVRDKVRYDLEYLERRSPLEDLRIMARTFPVMVLRRGSM